MIKVHVVGRKIVKDYATFIVPTSSLYKYICAIHYALITKEKKHKAYIIIVTM